MGANKPPNGKSRLTLAELRKKPPVCGVPIMLWTPQNELVPGSLEEVKLRTGSMGRNAGQPWSTAMSNLLQDEFNKTRFAMIFPCKMSVLFDGGNFNPGLSQCFLRRLRTIPTGEFKKWKEALDKVLHTDTDAGSIALTLVAVDRFYDKSDSYVPARAGKYVTRLGALSKRHIDLWVTRNPVYQSIQDDAALSIALTEEFFDGEQFDEETFQSVLDQDVPAPPTAGE
ncbi:MAG: hypothetical protein KAU28_10070 [Phycisphaerae bacterium]|nr:hypothetical protein [Phycisphaerae bacterium]